MKRFLKGIALLVVLALLLPAPLWASSAETLRNPQLENPTGLEEIAKALDPDRLLSGLEESLRVLLVEDEQGAGQLFKDTIPWLHNGATVVWVTNMADAQAALREDPPDVIITDKDYPLAPDEPVTTGAGIALIDHVAAQEPRRPVALFSGNTADAQEALNARVQDGTLVTYVQKPIEMEGLKRVLDQLVEKAHRAAAGLEETGQPGELPQSLQPGQVIQLVPAKRAGLHAVTFVFTGPIEIFVGRLLKQRLVLYEDKSGAVPPGTLALIDRHRRAYPIGRLFAISHVQQTVEGVSQLHVTIEARTWVEFQLRPSRERRAGLEEDGQAKVGVKDRAVATTREPVRAAARPVATRQVEADVVTKRFWEPIIAFIGTFRVEDPQDQGVIISGAIEGAVTVAAALGRAGVPVALVIEDATHRVAIATALGAMTAAQGDWLKNDAAGELRRRQSLPLVLPLVVASDAETARKVLTSSGVNTISVFINFRHLRPAYTMASIITVLKNAGLFPDQPAEPLLAASLEEGKYTQQFGRFYQ